MADVDFDSRNQAETNAIEEVVSNKENIRNSKDNTASKQIRMRVSSKHLMLASLVFKAKFQGEFKEGNTLRSSGFVEKQLLDDHPAAWLILNEHYPQPHKESSETDQLVHAYGNFNLS